MYGVEVASSVGAKVRNFLVTLKCANRLNSLSQKSKSVLLKDELVNFEIITSTNSTTYKSCNKLLIFLGVLDNHYAVFFVYMYMCICVSLRMCVYFLSYIYVFVY